jgi:hypothetical protein
MMLWGISGPRRVEVTGNRENFIMRSLMICTVQFWYEILRKTQPGTSRQRWVDNVK